MVYCDKMKEKRFKERVEAHNIENGNWNINVDNGEEMTIAIWKTAKGLVEPKYMVIFDEVERKGCSIKLKRDGKRAGSFNANHIPEYLKEALKTIEVLQ